MHPWFYALFWLSRQKLSRARRALTLLRSRQQHAVRVAILGEAKPLLELARSYFDVSRYHELLEQPHQAEDAWQNALNLCQQALRLAPSTECWTTFLRLKDKQVSRSEALSESADAPDSDGDVDPSLQQSIRECRQWLKSADFRDADRGTLEVWMLCREWLAEGSLIRRTKDKDSLSDLEWARFPRERKLEILEKLYRERKTALAMIQS